MLLVFAELLLPVVFRQRNTIPVWDKPLPSPGGRSVFWRDPVPRHWLSRCVQVWHPRETRPAVFTVRFQTPKPGCRQ